MPQPMTPAPQADLMPIAEALRKAGKVGAGFFSPEPRSPGAAMVAALRSLLPGRGSFRNELDRYNEAAGPEDSVMNRYGGQLPGETLKDAFMRQAMSPEAERLSAMAGGMAAPLVVHASPVKWSGQPTRAKAGSGEGGAAYGEGLYGSIPANAKGIDARYREQAAEFHRPVVRLDGFDLDTMAGDTFLMDALRKEFPKEVKPGQKIDAAGALQMARIKIEDKIAWAKREAERFKNSPDELNYYLNIASDYADSLDALSKLTPERFSVPDASGSFHVWDVPDNLLRWEDSLAGQTPEVKAALVRAKVMQSVEDNPGAVRMPNGEVLAAPEITGREIYRTANEGFPADGASEGLRQRGVAGHEYLGEAGSSGEAQGVPNFVIYDDAAVKPLGTFNSAEEFLASALYKQLHPRIKAEEAALVQRYPHLQSYFDSQGR